MFVCAINSFTLITETQYFNRVQRISDNCLASKKYMSVSQTVMPTPLFFILHCLKFRCGKVKPLLFFSEASILVFFHF